MKSLAFSEMLRKRNTTHGKSETREYRIWAGMIQRCKNPKVQRYPHYGGRGISVCDRWKQFPNFLDDMGLLPSPKHFLARIDLDGNYEPSNCRWDVSHGMRNTPEYRSWTAMMTRCGNPKHVQYASYGGRGITVCDRWKSFKNFYADMGPRPSGMSLDRVNIGLGYFLGNCKWSTPKEQANNRRSPRPRKPKS